MNHTINICLIPSWEIYDTCVKLSNLDSGSYNNNSRDFIPHATLGMKTLSDKQIESLYREIKNLNLQKQESNILWYYAREVPHAGLWNEFYEENEISFFSEEEYLARDGLHITLWKQDIETEYNNEDMPENITFDRLVIGKIWNYGSVREILFEIPLS